MHKLCFGGSFNPIHNGHLRCSQAVARVKNFQRVVLIPSAASPHKLDHADMADGPDRLAMCRLAIQGLELFEIDDVELKRTGPSYTIDTVRILRQRGWDEVHWLIGADQVHALPRWREPLALLREAHLLVMARPGWSFDWERLPPPFRALADRVVEAPLIDISATIIREKVGRHEPIDDLVPPPVARYIEQRGLYRGA